jgi:arsenate reductase (thioredoxin)
MEWTEAMKCLAGGMLLACLAACVSACASGPESKSIVGQARAQSDALYPEVADRIRARSAEFDQIPQDRREELKDIANYVATHQSTQSPAQLTFVCTHNSRRSHMAQLWAAAAAQAHGLRVRTFSGGTEATAFNPRAVEAMRRAGFRIEKSSSDANPQYIVRVGDDLESMTCFSKRYDAPPNPTTDFAAVMVCSEADEACPHVAGASDRFAVRYVDPKLSDGTQAESATYDERCEQIAREMAYVMSEAARKRRVANAQ